MRHVRLIGKTDNCRSYVQEGGKAEISHLKGKDKEELTAVPLTGNRKQTRSKRTNPEEGAEIPVRSRKGKK